LAVSAILAVPVIAIAITAVHNTGEQAIQFDQDVVLTFTFGDGHSEPISRPLGSVLVTMGAPQPTLVRLRLWIPSYGYGYADVFDDWSFLIFITHKRKGALTLIAFLLGFPTAEYAVHGWYPENWPVDVREPEVWFSAWRTPTVWMLWEPIARWRWARPPLWARWACRRWSASSPGR
jgi:hypothetical protein